MLHRSVDVGGCPVQSLNEEPLKPKLPPDLIVVVVGRDDLIHMFPRGCPGPGAGAVCDTITVTGVGATALLGK